MRAKGIDETGRLVIPKPYRTELGINPGDDLDIRIEGNKIIITKLNPECTFCGAEDELVKYKGKVFCSGCLAELKMLN